MVTPPSVENGSIRQRREVIFRPVTTLQGAVCRSYAVLFTDGHQELCLAIRPVIPAASNQADIQPPAIMKTQQAFSSAKRTLLSKHHKSGVEPLAASMSGSGLFFRILG